MDHKRNLLLKTSIVPKTKGRYKAKLSLFFDFCAKFKFDITQPTLNTVQLYLTHRAELGISGGVVEHELNAIKWHFRSQNQDFPWFSHKSLAMLVTAIKRQNPSRDQTKFPLTLPTIQHMMALVPTSDINSQVVRALITWLYTGANRSVEVIPKTQTDKHAALQLNHIKFYNNHGSHYMIYTFRDSKNNKTHQKQSATFPCLCKWGICAVKEIINYLKLRKLVSHAALFIWEDRTLVTYRQLLTQVRVLLGQIPLNLEPKDYGLHSFRKGCILDSIRLDVPLSICKQIGNWKCVESVDPYMKVDSHQLVQFRQNAIDTNLGPTSSHLGQRSVQPQARAGTQSESKAQPKAKTITKTKSQTKPRIKTKAKPEASAHNRSKVKPKKKSGVKPRKKRRQQVKHSKQDIGETICPCGDSDEGNMVQCTICDQWWHFDCQHLSNAVIATLSDSETEWFCSRCLDDTSE